MLGRFSDILLTAAFKKQYINEREALMVTFLGMRFGDWAHPPALPYSSLRSVLLPDALTDRHSEEMPSLLVVPAHHLIKEELGSEVMPQA